MDFNKFKDVENIKKEGIALWNDIVSEVKQLKNINGEKFKSGFNTYFVDYLKNDYVKFDGRVSRRQYWMFALYSMLISFVLGFVGGLIPFLSIISLLYVLAILVPSVGLGIRRLHDLNLSGWFFLICIIPFIGGIACCFVCRAMKKKIILVPQLNKLYCFVKKEQAQKACFFIIRESCAL